MMCFLPPGRDKALSRRYPGDKTAVASVIHSQPVILASSPDSFLAVLFPAIGSLARNGLQPKIRGAAQRWRGDAELSEYGGAVDQ